MQWWYVNSNACKADERGFRGRTGYRSLWGGRVLEHIEGASVILVGPQLRFRIPDFKKETDIPIVGISPQRYGLMDGKGVLKDIQEYL